MNEPLTPTRFHRLQSLFEQLIELAPEQRDAFLEAQVADPVDRQELLALLRAHGGDDEVFSQPLRLRAAIFPDNDAERWANLRVGPWQVTRRIGFGGMGTVCEAVRADEQFKKSVAIKFLHRHASTPAAVQRFKTERQILANLNHPNIAALLDGGVTADGQPYLVMEHIDGLPITQWCTQKSLSLRDRVALFLQVCAAVESAHRNLVVHLDLKPGNILVTQEARVKLLDFGIARLLGDDTPESQAAGTPDPRSFTPDYAAPEQVRSLPVSTATDVYALGVVLYELLTDRVPFDLRSKSVSEIEQIICGSPAPAAHLNADLDAIIERALRKDPQQRYSSAQDLGQELERYLAGQPVSAHPDRVSYRVGKFVGRHRIGTFAAALALLAVLTATGIAFWQAHVARRAANDTRELNDFLMEVLQMSDPFDTGAEITLSQALDEAAKRIDERFADRADLSAEIRFGVGYSMLSRYRLEAAETQLLRALTESQSEFGNTDIRTLRVMEGVAGLRHEQGRIEEAETLYLQTQQRIEAAGLQSDPLYMDVVGNLGNFYLTQERYPEADRLLQQALEAERLREEPDALDHANLLSNLAHVAHGLEDLERADKLYRQAQSAYEALFPEGNPDLAILFNNRALLEEDRNRDREALLLHRRSLEVRRRVFGSEHPMIVVALANVARLSVALGESQAALPFATEAVAMASRVYTEPNSRHASINATMAEAHLANADVSGAVASLLRAQSLLAEVDEPPPSVTRYLERVRTAICTGAGARQTICASKP